MKTIAIVPARFSSSRLPGKPLLEIEGYPMIWWTYQQCLKVGDFSDVIVATDDTRIFNSCKKYNIHVEMTRSGHLTGTDRVFEVAARVPADLYVNVQGDEPLLEPEVIAKILTPFRNDLSVMVANLRTKISNPCDLLNPSIPKVVTSQQGNGVYLSRSPIPYAKGSVKNQYYKQVCVYGFRFEALRWFASYGEKYGKSYLEKIEDIEILRFIENGFQVRYIDVHTKSVAVDTNADIQLVRELIRRRQSQ